MQPLPGVAAGEALRADVVNAIIGRLNAGTFVRGGAGISVTQRDDSVVIALDRAFREYVKPARIVSRTGNAIDEARNIRYTVQERDTGNVLADVFPSWGRPTRRDDVEIHAADVGSQCWLLLEPDGAGGTRAKLWLMAGGGEGEALAFYECGGGGVTPPPGALRVPIPGDMTILSPPVEPPDPGGPFGGTGGVGPSPTPAPPSSE